MQHDDDDVDMVKVFYHSLLLHMWMWCVCVVHVWRTFMCELLCELMAPSYHVDKVELSQGWSSF